MSMVHDAPQDDAWDNFMTTAAQFEVRSDNETIRVDDFAVPNKR